MTKQQRWLFAGGWLALGTGASQFALGTLSLLLGEPRQIAQLVAGLAIAVLGVFALRRSSPWSDRRSPAGDDRDPHSQNGTADRE
jgi:hypothetical protein